MKVLLIGEAKNFDCVKENFELSGFSVSLSDVFAGHITVRREKPDMIIVDMPELSDDCIQCIQRVRQEAKTPIILLSSCVDDVFKLIGLNLGINDYITRPLSSRELIARSRAVLRRANGSSLYEREIYRFNTFVLNATARQCVVNGQIIELTPVEYNLLYFLIRRKNNICTRSQLIEAAHVGGKSRGYERTVDAHIHNLRKKLEVDPIGPRYIRTVFGSGYQFTAE